MTNRELFKTDWGKGDQPSASEQNRIGSTLNRITSHAPTSQTRYTRVRLLRASEVLGKFTTNSTLAGDRKAKSVFYEATGDTFIANDEAEHTNVKDALGLVYDEGEKLFGFYCEQSGKFHPINPRTVRHAITVRDASNNYPRQTDQPDTYAIKFVKLVYTEAVGRQGHAMTYLNPTAKPDGFVHNIVPTDLGAAYLPQGTLIQVYNVTEQWFCAVAYAGEDASSQSESYSSFSSESSSNSSSNSSSKSSISQSLSSASSNSSSQSSSNSSSNSSSRSSQSLSDNSSSSSTSLSSRSSQSSGFDCVTVVTSLNFHAGRCVLTYCTRQICFPRWLGVQIGAASC